jgi:hypothetical protein
MMKDEHGYMVRKIQTSNAFIVIAIVALLL